MKAAKRSMAPTAREQPPDHRARAARRLWARLPLLLGGAGALVLGLATGLQRLGWDSLSAVATLADLHGPLMLCGFFGAVISIERAVALARNWAYLGPLAAVLATGAALAGLPLVVAQAGWIAAAAVLCAASAAIAWRHRALATAMLLVGALSWLAGTVAWSAGLPIHAAVLPWMGFLVLTIAAERLEFSRVLRRGALGLTVFAGFAAGLVAAIVLALAGSAMAWPAAGASSIAIVVWLVRHDLARRTIRLAGLPRYVAACLFAAYAWLALAGVLMAVFPLEADRLAYDAALHAVFLGFALTMIFGHAPIILPAIAGVKLTFRRVFYAPVVLLSASVAVRVCADLAGAFEARRWSGLLTVLAIVAFAGAMAVSARSARLGRPVCAGTKTGAAAGASLAP
jgi:hypothetical protein